MAIPIYDGYILYLINIFGAVLATQVVYDQYNTEYHGMNTMSPTQVEYDPLNEEYYTFYL